MKTKILIALVVVFVVIQFFRPEKNVSGEDKNHINTRYAMTDNVKNTLSVACNDCHSNRTEYPWYSHIQPVAWWLNDHINHGKGHLNFSDFTSAPIAEQNHKFEETIEVLEEGEMPLASYTWFGLHSDANLTEEQREMLISWAKAQMDSIKSQYPPDSLVRKKR
jgi:hypothetical protein